MLPVCAPTATRVPTLPVSALNGAVGLRVLTGSDRLAYWQVDACHRSAWLVARTVADQDGQRLFTDADVTWLARCPADLVGAIASAVRERNGLGGSAAQATLLALAEAGEERFAFRLSALLGAPDPETLVSHMSSLTFLKWQAFFALEPWGSAVDDERFGTVTAVLSNCHRDTKKRRDAFLPKDWFPRLDTTRPLLAEDDDAKEDRMRELLLRDLPLRMAGAGLRVDLAIVDDLFLSPADRVKKAAQLAAAAPQVGAA